MNKIRVKLEWSGWKQACKGLVAVLLVLLVSCEEDSPNLLVETITVSGDYITDGGTSQMEVAILPLDASNKEVTWSVDDESIATISEKGLLTALRNGTVEVTAMATDGSQVSGSRIINISGVFEPPVLIEAIEIIGNDISDGNPQQLSISILPENATNQEVIWSISPENLASISETGRLIPLDNGSVTVLATAQDGSDVVGSLVVEISGIEEPVDGEVVETSADLLLAIDDATPGTKIYLRGGTYEFNSSIRLDTDGQSDQMISLLAYPGDPRPVLDFSAMSENSSNRAVRLSADYWHVKGLNIYGAGDNGMFISGHNNLVEFCYFYENADTGLQIGNGASNNTILNCDSYFNADSSIENADGFACKLDAGDGNRFIGCRAWQNLDDGWDGYLRGTDNITTIYENCWAIRNGVLKDGTIGGGDGNGFKTGGSDDKLLSHHAVLTNCIAAGNVVDGFDHNSNRGDITIYNSAGHDNGRNFGFGGSNIANSLIVKNSVSLSGSNGDSFNAGTTDVTNNSWQDGLSATTDDYSSIDIDLLLSPRQADGSLPDITYFQLVSGSDLIDAGTDVGLDFNGTAPDIGPFESDN